MQIKRTDMENVGAEVGYPCEGRLTLVTGVPVMASNVTAATSVYFTPYRGDRIALYDGSEWLLYTFAELTIDLTGFAADTNFDVFAHDSSGSVALETVAWTNGTTRATALALQDGIYVKSGDATRRYLGTFRTTGTTGQTEWTPSEAAAAGGNHPKLFVWNYYNRVDVSASNRDSTNTWVYTTATLRAKNNSTENRISYVCGVVEDGFSAILNARGDNDSTCFILAAIGADSTSAAASGSLIGGNFAVKSTGEGAVIISTYAAQMQLGFHYLQELEYSNATGTTTWFGDANAPTLFQTGLNFVARL